MQLNKPHNEHASLEAVKKADGSIVLYGAGNWTADSIQLVAKQCDATHYAYNGISVRLDLSKTNAIDSAGMTLIINLYGELQKNNCIVTLVGLTDKHQRLITFLRSHIIASSEPIKKPLSYCFWHPFKMLGKGVTDLFSEILLFMSFFGESTIVFLQSLIHPSQIRYGAIIKNIEEAGVRAIPIIALTSFLIGIVVTYQGAVQLVKFGANIFIVDMISISVTRELAPLITAIVVAGRTGSSYTAQLGVMKITEEIDAMRTMGFNPYHFLVIPRILALMITLPLLVFFADIIGLAAGMLIADLHLQLSFTEFLHRLQNVLAIKHVWIGLIKAPFFAWLIATVSCFRGFQVEKNTDSIGRYTTISVVNSIFLVIACDAIFSVILTELGI